MDLGLLQADLLRHGKDQPGLDSSLGREAIHLTKVLKIYPVLFGNPGEGLSGANRVLLAFRCSFLAKQGKILSKGFLFPGRKFNLELGAVGGNFFLLERRVEGLNFGQICFSGSGDQV